MTIKKGSSRIVFCFRSIVIKIPRFRIGRLLSRLVVHTKNKTVQATIEKFGNNIFSVATNYLFDGVRSNRLEHRFSQRTNSPGILPTKSFLWGCILVQKRGEVLHEQDRRWIKIRRIVKKYGIAEKDTTRANNFCIIDNCIKMVDYGRAETINALETGNLFLIEKFGKLETTM